jgi:integrase
MPRRDRSKRWPENVIRRKSSIFYYRKFEKGRDRWVSLRTKDENLMREKVRQIERALARGERQILDRRTVAQAMPEYLAAIVSRRHSERDHRVIAQRVRDYVIPYLGSTPLGQVTVGQIEDFRDNLLQHELSEGTVRNLLSDCVRQFFNWAVRRGYVASSPFVKGIMPRSEERAPDRLSEGEVEKVRVIPEPWGFVARLGLATGLRWSELCKARAEHLQRTPDGWSLLVPKSKSRKSRSVLVLDGAVVQEIRSHIGKLVPFSEKSSGSFNAAVIRHSGLIETSTYGGRFHVHQLRHTFGCRYMEAGGELLALKELMGHTDIATTMRYAAVAARMVGRDAARVSARLAEL